MQRRVGAVVAFAILALAGCGGDGEEGKAPATPAGWKLTESEYFSVAHPRDWQVRTSDEGGDVVTRVTAQGNPDPIVQMVVGVTPKYTSGFKGAVEINETNALARFPGRKVVKQAELDVPGAEKARLTEAELPPSGRPGTPDVPVRLYDLVALSKQETAVNLVAQARVADADRVRLREVVDSLRLKK